MLEVPEVSLENILETTEQEIKTRSEKDIRRIVKDLTELLVNEELENG